VVNADSASAASGCNTPVTSYSVSNQGGTQWFQGKGSFGCTNVNNMASKVQVYYKLDSASPRSGTGNTRNDP
jgi:hypothetical protein